MSCMCVHVRSVLSGTVAWAPRPWNFPGKNTRVGCHFLLEGTFLIQGLKLCLLGLLHWQADSGPPGKPKQRAVNTDTRRPAQPPANGALGCCCHLLATTGTWLRSPLEAGSSLPEVRGPRLPLLGTVRRLHDCQRNSVRWEWSQGGPAGSSGYSTVSFRCTA